MHFCVGFKHISNFLEKQGAYSVKECSIDATRSRAPKHHFSQTHCTGFAERFPARGPLSKSPKSPLFLPRTCHEGPMWVLNTVLTIETRFINFQATNNVSKSSTNTQKQFKTAQDAPNNVPNVCDKLKGVCFVNCKENNQIKLQKPHSRRFKRWKSKWFGGV